MINSWWRRNIFPFFNWESEKVSGIINGNIIQKLVRAAREAIQNCIKSISCLCASIVFIVTSIMAALEWNTNLYLLPVAHQAQAGPGLAQNSSVCNRLSFSLSFTLKWSNRSTLDASMYQRDTKCSLPLQNRNRVSETCWNCSRRTVHEETRLERIKKSSRWILAKCFAVDIYLHNTHENA